MVFLKNKNIFFIILLMLVVPVTILKLLVLDLKILKISVSLKLDLLSIFFVMILCIIFLSIMKFSDFYMNKKMNYWIFSSMMCVFVFSMVLLIFSNSLLTVVVSWELLGMSSWFLVMFYFTWASFQGSTLTIYLNRFGDSFLFMSMFIFNFMYSKYMVLIITMMVLTKSAQFPFNSWLPAAMAAPTPVSALVHSSTLVTAGLYLLMRFFYPIYNTCTLKMLLLVGIVTMLFGGTMASYSPDLKKIVAFSTLSQLGLMMCSFCSLNWGVLMTHLISHAFAKSMMFMQVGLIMIKIDSQQMKKSSMKFSSMKNIFFFLTIILNFISFLFTFMYFTKENLLLQLINFTLPLKIFTILCFLVTIMYSSRLLTIFYLTCYTKSSSTTMTQFMKSKLVYLLSMTILSFMFFTNCMEHCTPNFYVKLTMVLYSLMIIFMFFRSLPEYFFVSLNYLTSFLKFKGYYFISKEEGTGFLTMFSFFKSLGISKYIKFLMLLCIFCLY